MSNSRKNYHDHLEKLGVRTGPEMTILHAPADNLDERTEIMICDVCKIQLNRFSGPDGEQWVHSRAWERYDHDAAPVQITRPDWHTRDILCDFCGVKNTVAWKYTGDRFQQVSGNLGSDYGTAWGACRDCGEFIDDRDVDGLMDRIMAKSSVVRDARNDPESVRLMRLRMYELHSKFIPTIHTKEYIGPPIVPSKLTPRLMPKIQQGLHRYWTQDALFERLIKPGFYHSTPGIHAGFEQPGGDPERFQVRYDNGTMPHDVFTRHIHHLAVGVQGAELFWVSRDFTHLAATAGQDLKDISISREELPSPHGLIIWEDPIGEIPRPYGTASIRAISWTLVPEGLWINVYIQGEDADPTITDIAELRAKDGYLICPNIGAGIPFVGLGGIDTDFQREGNFLLTLIATWSLMTQPGVADTEVAQPDKKLQRAARRSGRSIPDVRIISLRKRPRPARDTEAEGGYELKYRRFTHGHWKMQFYGPKRGLRKRIYVSPYIARPDLPERPPQTPTVKVLR